MSNYDVIIVGAGPTGICCGIEAKKAGLSYLILDKGVLVNSLYHFPRNMTFFSTSLKLEIGNVPFISHTDKPTRDEALEYYRRVASSYDLNIQLRIRVHDVTKIGDSFVLEASRGKLTCKNVVIATGFYDTPRELNIEGESLPKVKHYYDDAHLYIGQDVIVVGGANSACDAALETWSKGANVTMVVREAKLYEKVKYWILPNIQNRIKEGSIKAYFNSELKLITKDNVRISTPEGEIQLKNDYVLAMTGYTPNYDWLKTMGINFNKDDYKTPTYNSKTLESNVKGLYLAGVILSGLATSSLFIENTRHHGAVIIEDIMKKKQIHET
jgi:thioredoxin reductase (NADPH)